MDTLINKKCGRCGLDIPVINFGRNKKAKDGKFNWCKSCCAAYYQEHREKIIYYQRVRRAKNPGRPKHWSHDRKTSTDSQRASKRMERVRAAPGNFSAQKWEQRLDVIGRQCFYCGAPYETIDHVRPLSRDGTNYLSNMKPACLRCNTEKGKKTHKEYLAYREWKMRVLRSVLENANK